jgi:hypothetical protein
MQLFKRKKTKNKYHSKKCAYDDIKFDSEREKDVYIYLESMLEKGEISNLSTHPKWELIPAIKENYTVHLKTKDKVKERTVQLPITYSADFSFDYMGANYVLDVKVNPRIIPKEYRLKVKMLRYFHGIKVIEIYKMSDLEKIFK